MKEDIRREDDACVFRILPAQMGQAKGEISIGKKRGDTVSTLTLLSLSLPFIFQKLLAHLQRGSLCVNFY